MIMKGLNLITAQELALIQGMTPLRSDQEKSTLLTRQYGKPDQSGKTTTITMTPMIPTLPACRKISS